MRIALVMLLASSTAYADDPPVALETLHQFPGVDVVRTINQARHEHGGPPARVGHVSINFELRDARPHTVAVKKLDAVFSECDVSASKRAKTSSKSVAVLGYHLYTWDDADPIAKGTSSIRLTGGPRRLQVQLDIAGFETYRGCAFAIDLMVDRVRKQIELPLTIVRMEPLRRPKQP